MTNEEMFQTLLQMAYAFGCDIIEADENNWPEDRKGRAFFRVSWTGIISKREELEIWLRDDLSLPEKIEVMIHEIAHLAFYLFGIPYQELHEVSATLFGKCLLAALREDWANPLFEMGPIVQLEKRFLELLRDKRERTALGLAQLDEAYFKFKKEQERELK